jgi:FAD/FMN-containing dehydrogenase
VHGGARHYRPVDDAALLEDLRRRCGADSVVSDDETRRFMSQDSAAEGVLPLVVFAPETVEALADGVRLLTAAGVAVHPRGGGMSYTDAFLPQSARAAVIDTGRLNRVVEIDPNGLWVTVEAGCTWAALDAALAPHGLRTPFWGPFSGFTATVGGSLSQGTATFGSGYVGSSGNAVLGLEIVLADGRRIVTGSGGRPGATPFDRNYGPDLTGMFLQDAGAFGIKARCTLPLEPRPVFVDGLSFLFADFAALTGAMAAVAREGLAAESFAMDPVVTQQFADQTPKGIMADLKALGGIVANARGPLAKLKTAAGVALGGRGFLSRPGYHCHFTVEGRSARDLAERLDAVVGLAKRGTPLPPTVPRAVRAAPFAPLPVLSPKGERVLPIHGIIPYAAAGALDAALGACVAEHRAALDAASVTVASSFFGLGRAAFLYEPVLYWPDARTLYHERRTPEGFPRHADNPAAREIVAVLKTAMIDAMHAHGATHLQIGRLYPWTRGRSDDFMNFARALKAEVDPKGLMNPGALGI